MKKLQTKKEKKFDLRAKKKREKKLSNKLLVARTIFLRHFKFLQLLLQTNTQRLLITFI